MSGEEGKCQSCQEHSPRYGDQFCSDECAKVFKLLQKQKEFLDGLKKLSDEERIEAMKRATNSDGLMRTYIDPLLPGDLLTGG